MQAPSSRANSSMKEEYKPKSGMNISRESEQQSEHSDAFSIDEIPNKVLLVDPRSADGEINLIAYHAEAQYSVRRLIIDVAKRHFKELEKLNLNAVLAHTAQKSK